MKIHVFFIGQVILLDQKTGIQIPPLCHSPKYNSPKIAEVLLSDLSIVFSLYIQKVHFTYGVFGIGNPGQACGVTII